MTATISILLGVSIGSFINSCVYRIPRGVSLVARRSFCPYCNTQLHWFELIPVASYVVLRGRCRHCNDQISIRYPLVELFSGFLVSMLVWQHGISVELLYAGSFALLMLLVALIDWQYLIIPNVLVLIGFLAALAMKLFIPWTTLLQELAAAVFIAMILMLFVMGVGAVLRKEAMGMGDVKLAALIVFFIGPLNFLISLWLAATTGAIYGVARRWKENPGEQGEKIPFGSFLAFASVMVFLMNDSISDWAEQWLM